MRDRSQSLLSDPRIPTRWRKEESSGKGEAAGEEEAPPVAGGFKKAARYTENTALSQLRTVRRITHWN